MFAPVEAEEMAFAMTSFVSTPKWANRQLDDVSNVLSYSRSLLWTGENVLWTDPDWEVSTSTDRSVPFGIAAVASSNCVKNM